MEEKIQKTLNGLKDFQLKTVDYVFDQLYNKGRHKMLVADEVGLGKTIVAKGVIAKAFDLYMKNGGPTPSNPTFNVIYICSNLALATQNIRKLNFTEDGECIEPDINRLVYLSYKSRGKPPLFLINSLTPGTSFSAKSSTGAAEERIILLYLLSNNKVFRNRWSTLKWLLKGKVDTKNWNWMIETFNEDGKKGIRRDLYIKFRNALRTEMISRDKFPRLYDYYTNASKLSVWNGLLKICNGDLKSQKIPAIIVNEVILNLRRILSRLCLEYLNADIFILDEFQRYNNLIKFDEEAENPAMELARAVFDIKDAKILMLSATPFKPFTNDFDEQNGEIHYKEFESVLKFLQTDKDSEYWLKFRKDRKAFFSFLRHPSFLNDHYEEVLDIKQNLESRYRDCIVRTERMLVSQDRDAMVSTRFPCKKSNANKAILGLDINMADIEDFVSLDKITQILNKNHKANLPVPLEYIKSSPFALSFLDNYQHRKKLESFVNKDIDLRKLLNKTKNAWVNLENIDNYKPIITGRSQKIPNAKLRLLLDTCLNDGGWKYLWIPPTLSYYNSSGAYKGSSGFSKTLLFSSWVMVPRMISTLVSYEAERLSIGEYLRKDKQENNKYFSRKGKRRSPYPQFNFRVEKEDNEPKQMRSMSLLFPSVYLAKLYDPITNLVEGKSLLDIATFLKNHLKAKLLSSEIQDFAKGDGDWLKWYWVAPLLLDKISLDHTLFESWLIKGLPSTDFTTDSEDDQRRNEDTKGKSAHFRMAHDAFINPFGLNLPILNIDQAGKLAEFLTNLCLGSPAVCYLRTQLRYFDIGLNILDASFNIASGFITLLNKPESIAIIRLTTSAEEYLNKVLEYSIDGNMQSLLDEYVYMIRNCENLTKPNNIADHISDILTVRTSSIEIDDLQSFTYNSQNGDVKKKRRSIRTHYAMDFNSQKLESSRNIFSQGAGPSTGRSNLGRQVGVRQAFNSPFRPFVLATTSIGQEGLDFHMYCRRIFHWNIPANAIDFEQREGRIHRYMGLVIRQNLVDKYKKDLSQIVNNSIVWEDIFKIASKEKGSSKTNCDLVPFWHTESISDIKIERYVPMYPFSRDIDRYKQLLKVLAFYRLTFGQPRQEELIDAISNENFNEDSQKRLEELIINLSPISFLNSYV